MLLAVCSARANRSEKRQCSAYLSMLERLGRLVRAAASNDSKLSKLAEKLRVKHLAHCRGLINGVLYSVARIEHSMLCPNVSPAGSGLQERFVRCVVIEALYHSTNFSRPWSIDVVGE